MAATTVADVAIFAGGLRQNGTSYPYGIPILENAPTVLFYNTVTDVWEERGSLLSANGSSLATTIDTRSLFINGRTLGVDIYESSNDTWAVAPPLLTSVTSTSASAVTVDSKAIVVGDGVV